MVSKPQLIKHIYLSRKSIKLLSSTIFPLLHIPVNNFMHIESRQSAWHQKNSEQRMGWARAPCCPEEGRRRKQNLANGDMTCSPGHKLKQTINGP